MAKLTTIETGTFKLDGGAMFGVVPKRMWEKLNPPDDKNLCTWSLRCLLYENGDRKMLIDTGIGNKQNEKFRSHFEPTDTDALLRNLAAAGVQPTDITDVFLTHLHFDHSGGACRLDAEGRVVPTFPNATYWTNERHWAWAMNPNAREQASFLKENFVPLQENGVLRFAEHSDFAAQFPEIDIWTAFGHTEAMMMLKITVGERVFFHAADTIPSSWHVNMPYVMAYDVRPLDTLSEKKAVLEAAVTEGWFLFFEHDPFTELATLKRDEAGRITVDQRLKLSAVLAEN